MACSLRVRSAQLDELLQASGRQPSDVKRALHISVFCGRDVAEFERRLRRFAAWAVPVSGFGRPVANGEVLCHQALPRRANSRADRLRRIAQEATDFTRTQVTLAAVLMMEQYRSEGS